MDFVYTDVWGNRTSGAEDAWQTSKLSNMLRDNGWRMVQEWCYANAVSYTHLPALRGSGPEPTGDGGAQALAAFPSTGAPSPCGWK